MPYPDGMPASYRSVETLCCEKCGYKWEAEFIHDLGMSHFYYDEDGCCPDCEEPYDA